MKFALISSLLLQEDLSALAEKRRSWEFDGVEVEYPAKSNAEISKIFAEAGLQIACIHLIAQFRGNATMDAKAADEIRSCIDAAQKVGCHIVKLPEAKPPIRESVMATINAMADWLSPLGDAAAARGINLLVENGHIFATARTLWMLMERVDHPAIGICWNVSNSLVAGERLAVTVPTLNSRIRYVRMGDEAIHEAMTRLRGIGYQGWVAYTKAIGTPEKFLTEVRAESGGPSTRSKPA